MLRWCRDEPELRFDVLMDLTAVDYLKYPGREDGPRFEVVYHLFSVGHNHRLRLKVRVDEDDAQVPTAVDLWPIANWLEREVWDMFGVRFAGHPDPRRLLMYEEFVGHALRKDYPINRRQPLIGPQAVARPWPRRPPGRSCWARAAGRGSGQNLQVGVGPAHPAMHGIIRINAELDGEVIRKADVEIGYLHRAFEKDCEVGGYNNAIPYTDRLNYVSPLINNFAYASAVEKLLGIDVTERCKFIRTAMSEISRVCDHLTCVGASAMELGAFTVFLYMIKAREFLWELVEDVTGARLTISYGRVGGVKADLPEGFAAKVAEAFKRDARGARRGPPAAHRQPHLHGPHGGRRPALARGDARLRHHRAAAARRRRAATTCAARSRTGPTTGWSSRSRPRRTATTTPATSCAWPRWSSRCASPSRRWRRCRAAPINVDFEGRPIDPARLRGPGQAGQDGRPAAGADPPVAESAGPEPRRRGSRQHRRQARGRCRRRRPPTARSRG